MQKISSAIEEERAIRGFGGTYAVIVDRPVSVNNRDRIAWTPKDGSALRYLDIVGVTNPETIADLPIIDAHEVI